MPKWKIAAAMLALAGPAMAGEAATPALQLPPGFEANLVATLGGHARHMVVRDNGDLLVAIRKGPMGPGVDSLPEDNTPAIHALRDSDGDGSLDQHQAFGPDSATGMALYQGYLYIGTEVSVLRVKLDDGLAPKAAVETVIAGFPEQRQHGSKSIAIGGDGKLYVNRGAPANACQQRDRQPGVPGINPCPLLDIAAGIWRYDPDRLDQQPEDGERVGTGIRNAMAIDWNDDQQAVYFLFHGRDQLGQLWPKSFTIADSAEKPAEEFHRLTMGGNYGWPYSYYDPTLGQRMQAPEYGGDGKTKAAGDYAEPLVGFPAHWAPNDLLFYRGSGFPAEYQGGALIAFHGSWNRSPLPQGGYAIVFQPMKAGLPDGPWRVFADGFKGADTLVSPSDAVARPTGLAEAPDGSIYVSDSVKGRVWRIRYAGQ